MCTIIAIFICWMFDVGVWLIVLGFIIDIVAYKKKGGMIMPRRIPSALQVVGKWLYDFGKDLRQTMDAVSEVRKKQKEVKKAKKADEK